MTQHLDQFMDDFGDRLAQATPPKRPRRKRIALGGALLVAAATPLAILIPGGGGSPVNAIAAAREALDPKDSIVHLRYRVTSSMDEDVKHESEIWTAGDPDRQHLVATSEFPNGKTAVSEHALVGDETHTYERDRDMLHISRAPEMRPTSGPAALLGPDPAGALESMLASGAVTDGGEVQDGGRTVHRFTGSERNVDFVYDVDPQTFAPVRMTARYTNQSKAHEITLDVVQYERLKKTPANEQLLSIRTTRETKLQIFGRSLAERYAVSGGGITCERKGKTRYRCRHR